MSAIVCIMVFIVGLAIGFAVDSILFQEVETKYISPNFHGVYFSPNGG